jgi:hypothetical protein
VTPPAVICRAPLSDPRGAWERLEDVLEGTGGLVRLGRTPAPVTGDLRVQLPPLSARIAERAIGQDEATAELVHRVPIGETGVGQDDVSVQLLRPSAA